MIEIDPGWRKIKVQPIPGGTITSAKATYESPYGRVECAWEVHNNEEFVLDLVVPPNSRALVVLPNDNEELWVGSGRHSFTRAYSPANGHLRRFVISSGSQIMNILLEWEVCQWI